MKSVSMPWNSFPSSYARLLRRNNSVVVRQVNDLIHRDAPLYGLAPLTRAAADASFRFTAMSLRDRITNGKLSLTNEEIEELEGDDQQIRQILTKCADVDSVATFTQTDSIPWLRSYSALQVAIFHELIGEILGA